MGERTPAERPRPRPVGDRPRDVGGRPRDDLAGRERLPRVGAQFRLDADHPRFRHKRPDRDCDPAGEPAAADRDEDRGDVGQRLGDLEADRALAGDHPVVVEGRNDRETPFRGDPLGDGLTLVARRADDDDLRAVRGDSLALDRRRIRGHDDDRRCTQKPRRPSDALGVVARRVGDDAAGAFLGGQGRDCDVRAADLERADRLEALGLEEAPVLGWPERNERRADGDAGEGRGRLDDPLEPDEGRLLGRGPRRRRLGRPDCLGHPPRPTIRWQSMQ
jgi:hypothetical protein